jgi:abortive infection bacteriophage resistance protein
MERGPGGKSRYDKPWLTLDGQLELLERRGLAVPDRESARAFLRHANYDRFSGYFLAFESDRHRFVAGTRFEEIRHAYEFDVELRHVLWQAMELVELDARTSIAYSFGQTHGAFGHVNPQVFHASRAAHAEWIAAIQRESERSHELFARHFKDRYAEFPNLPIWAAAEIASFGAISRMLKMMRRDDQRRVAQRYGVQPQVLCSWLHHLSYVRNICAHHGRIWDRAWSIKPMFPRSERWSGTDAPDASRRLATLLVLKSMLDRCHGQEANVGAWMARAEQALARLPSAPGARERLGVPGAWIDHPVWRAAAATRGHRA